MDKAADGTVRASVRIVDAGGGIGSKVIWKVNGLSQGSSVAPDPADQRFTIMTNTIQVDPSKTADVEVVAYNREGLRASDPLHFKIDAYGASSFGAPRLFVLAVGVGKYAMTSYRLNYPDDDAKQLTEKLSLSGRLLFGENQVVTKVLTATDVNERTIAATFGTLSQAIKPTDVFVLFLSGHGENRLGRYYYIPQDFDVSKGDTWDKTWIGQDKWEKWLAGITAEKQLLILDTCEGEAALGLIKGLPERQTAMDQLRYATGRNIIAAASGEAKEANELGHGILTYTLLQALQKTPSQRDDTQALVTVFGLASFANIHVPEIRKRIFDQYVPPISKLTRNDFGIGFRIEGDAPPIQPPPPSTQYVVMLDEFARSSIDGPVNRPIVKGTVVNVQNYEGEWALIAREGSQLGLVPAGSLLRLQ